MPKPRLLPVLIATLLCTHALHAEQYLVTVAAPHEEVPDNRYSSLKVTPLDSFSQNGFHFVVLETEDNTRIETMFNVCGQWPLELDRVDGNWTDDDFAIALRQHVQDRQRLSAQRHLIAVGITHPAAVRIKVTRPKPQLASHS